MADIVKARRLFLDDHELCAPGPGAEQTAADVPYAAYRIMLKHHAHRDGVIEIDPVGELLWARETGDRARLERRDIAVKERAAGGIDAAVCDAIDAVASENEIGPEKPAPGGMIWPSRCIGVVLEPMRRDEPRAGRGNRLESRAPRDQQSHQRGA